MKFGRQYVHCGNCGKRLVMGAHWQNSMAKAPTCDKTCNDELDLKYARYIIGKDVDEPIDKPAPDVVWPGEGY